MCFPPTYSRITNEYFSYFPGMSDIAETFAKCPPSNFSAYYSESNILLNLFLNQSSMVVNETENYQENIELIILKDTRILFPPLIFHANTPRNMVVLNILKCSSNAY